MTGLAYGELKGVQEGACPGDVLISFQMLPFEVSFEHGLGFAEREFREAFMGFVVIVGRGGDGGCGVKAVGVGSVNAVEVARDFSSAFCLLYMILVMTC